MKWTSFAEHKHANELHKKNCELGFVPLSFLSKFTFCAVSHYELHNSLSAQPSHSMGRKHSLFMFHSSHTKKNNTLQRTRKQILARALQFRYSGPSPIHTNLCTVDFRVDSTVAELDSPPGQSRELNAKSKFL